MPNLFDGFVKSEHIILDTDPLKPEFKPGELKHREKQVEQLVNILGPATNGKAPANVLAIGSPGTGKTLTISAVGQQLEDIASIPFVHVQCSAARGEYAVTGRLGYQLSERYSKTLGLTGIPRTGWILDKLYKTLGDYLKKLKKPVVLALDDIHVLTRKGRIVRDGATGNSLLKNILDLNRELRPLPGITVIGVTNYDPFERDLDEDVASRFGGEKVVFPRYDARQLTGILDDRAKVAFRPNSYGSGVISRCAAEATQLGGDARVALSLLRSAAMRADHLGDAQIEESHLEYALKNMESESALQIITRSSDHEKILLLSIAATKGTYSKDGTPKTGEIYKTYTQMCKTIGRKPLSDRRLADLIYDLAADGIVETRVVSFGRGGGRSQLITLNVGKDILSKAISDSNAGELLEDFIIPATKGPDPDFLYKKPGANLSHYQQGAGGKPS